MSVRREPVAIVNAIRLAILAAITFGLAVTDTQLIATMAALEAGLTLFSRQQVTPNETAEENIDTAVRLAHMGQLPPPDDIAATGSPDQ